MKTKFFVVVFLAILKSNTAEYDYSVHSGEQIWKLYGNLDTVKDRLHYLKTKHGLDILGHDGQIRVLPKQASIICNDLIRHKLHYKILVEDLQVHLQEHESTRLKRDVGSNECTSNSCTSLPTNGWMTFHEMEAYLRHINETYYPKVEVTSIGKSNEDNDIWMVHIKNYGDAEPKNAVWIEAGIHAREWISNAVGLYVIDMLANQVYSSSDLEFYVVPIANPDGYIYSHTSNRFWRKNRRVNKNTNCVGVDLNRNWDFHYGSGASTNPCADDYLGSAPFSEPETLALSAKMKQIKNLELVLALHSYGQILLYPWGWTHSPPPDERLLKQLGKIFQNTMSGVNDNRYSMTPSSKFYIASGATDDWAKGILNVTYSYTLELPSKSSFIVSVDDIPKIWKEVWTGLVEGFKTL